MPSLSDLTPQRHGPLDLRDGTEAREPGPEPGGTVVDFGGLEQRRRGSDLPLILHELRGIGRTLAARFRNRERPLDPILVVSFPQRGQSAPAGARRRTLLSVVVVTLVVIGIFRLLDTTRKIGASTDQALLLTREAADALVRIDVATAGELFRNAERELAHSEQLIEEFSAGTALPDISPVATSASLVTAARETAAAGRQLSDAIAAAGKRDTREAFLLFGSALTDLHAAREHIDATNPALLRAKDLPTFLAVRESVRAADDQMLAVKHALPELSAIFGAEEPKRYLVLFQNNTELRGTGGFLGSFAVLDVDALAVKRFDFKDVYEVDWKQVEEIAPPGGLARYYDGMHLRDSNYSPDFPTAAAWIERFYEGSGGTSVDGVIAIDATYFLDILDALGPLTMPGSDIELARENALDQLTLRIETSKGNPQGPKAFMADLITQLEARLGNAEAWPLLAEATIRARDEKHLQMYFDDRDAQALVSRYGLDGALPPPADDVDEVGVVVTNVGGNKSDRFVARTLEHEARIRPDGTVASSLLVRSIFTMPASVDARIAELVRGRSAKERSYLTYVFGKGANTSYVRVYLPKGTRIAEVTGVDRADWTVREELERLVLDIHLVTNVGETRDLRIAYTPPVALNFIDRSTYRFSWWKQAGVDRQRLLHTLTADSPLRFVGHATSRVHLEGIFADDVSSGVVVTK